MKLGFIGATLPAEPCLMCSHRMYETQFGLNKRPFRALARGSDVFVGPQTASAMAGLKKALATPDAIVAVSGPVGVGKTTIVRRALAAIGKDQIVITVGRMQLGHDEVLELLLEEMGVELPSGTVQRFTTFRRLLKQHADAGSRVFIVVEDVSRIGVDALSELEALTASDAGVSEGANIVLMGDENLNEVLKTPHLARLKQRLRLKQVISPFSASELMGYFKHCFRLAGNEFDSIFEDGASEVLHRLSEGIPRIANNLVESSLISAVDNKLDRVNVAQIKLVASEEYGLDIARESQHEPAVAPAAEPPPAPVQERTPPQVPEPVQESTPAPEPEQPSQESAPVPEPEPVAAVDDIPELIQDTLPDLEILAPSLAQPAEPQRAQKAVEPELPELPELPAATEAPQVDLEAAQVEAPEDEVPEWERDPTLAQLRPDLDALEHAMAVAQGLAPDPERNDAAEPVVKAEEAPEPMPEITLDREIQTKVEKAAAALKEEEEKRAAAEARAEAESPVDNRPTAEILAEARAKEQQQEAPDNSVEAQFAAAIPASAGDTAVDLNESTDTIADLPVLQDMTSPAFEPAAYAEPEPAAEAVAEALPELKPEAAPIPELSPELETEAVPEPAPEPDPVAEENARKADAELEQIAENLARARTIDDCDDKMAETLFGEEFSMMAAEVAAMAPPELSANDDIEEAAGEVASGVPDFDGAAAVNIEMESEPNGAGGPMDLSASQRLATVRALNATPEAESAAPVTMPAVSQDPPPPAVQPESIEDQINTSMTQTLQALGNTRPPDIHDDDDEKPKGGFFSRFKRS
jgi:general secretion pathway protein A